MAMKLRKRRFRPMFHRYLYRRVDDPNLDGTIRERIMEVLEDEKKLEKLTDATYEIGEKAPGGSVWKTAGLDAEGLMAANLVGGPVLDAILVFLNEHWDEIFALILKLLGV